MKRCFILEPTKLDTSLVEDFGERVWLFDGNERPSIFEHDFDEAVLRRIEQFKYNPDEDFFVIAGDIAAVSRAMSALGQYFDGCFDLLIWDASNRVYKPLIWAEHNNEENTTRNV